MPTYTVTNSQGQSLKITGDKPPSEKDLNTIFSEYSQKQKTTIRKKDSVKLTEESIVKDPNWIKSSKNVYKMNEGANAPDLESDDAYAKYALNYMGWFNYNLPKMGLEATQLKQATSEQQKDFVTLMDMYDEKEASFAGFGRALKGIATDPSTFVGITTLGAGTLGAQALKQGIKEGVKQATKAGLKRGAAIGSIEGATYAAADNALRQTARINANAQESFELGQTAKSAALGASLGAGLGGALGGTVGAIAAKNSRKIIDNVVQKEEPSIVSPEKTVKDVETETQEILKQEVKDIQEPKIQPNSIEEPSLEARLKDIEQPLDDITIAPKPIEDSALGKLFPPYQKVANQIIDFTNRKLSSYKPLGSLPEQEKLLTLKGLATGKLEKVRNITRDVFENFTKLSPEENLIVRKAVLKEIPFNEINNLKLKKQAQDLRKGIDFIGKALVKKGILDETIIKNNEGSYLPKMYLKYLDKKGKRMGYTIPRKELDDDVTQFLGEIQDIALQGSKAIEEPMSDIVRHGLFEKIAENPNWVLKSGLIKFKGKDVSPVWLKEESERIQREIRDNLRPKSDESLVKSMDSLLDEANLNIKKSDLSLYKQVPDNKHYGTLRGSWIRKEIHNDLISAGEFVNPNRGFMQSILGDYGTITKATKLWKMSKVPLNPPTVIRNMISNTMLLNLSGVAWRNMPKRYIQAMKDMSTNGPYTEIARKYGVIDTTFTKQEMIQINKAYLKAKAKQTGNFIDQTKYIAGAFADNVTNVYQKTEILGKVVKIIDDMSKGVDEATAVLNAQKTLFDYSLVPSSVRYLRNSPLGMPFITFYYKVLPNLLETLIKNPQRYAPYAAIPYGMHSLIANYQGVSNEDFNKLKETLPEYLRDRGNALALPVKDEQGRWQFLDFSYFLPYAMFTGMAKDVADGEFGRFTQSSGILGGPVPQLITALQSNKDPFTQREIVNEFDPPEKRTADMMLYLYRMAAPTWLTDIGFAGKMYEAVNKDLNKYGDPKITKTQALGRLFGFNVYPIDPELSRSENLRRMKYEISRVKARKTKALKDPNLTREERKKINDKYLEMIKGRQTQIQEYVKASNIRKELR
jgi:hypothetical protein